MFSLADSRVDEIALFSCLESVRDIRMVYRKRISKTHPATFSKAWQHYDVETSSFMRCKTLGLLRRIKALSFLCLGQYMYFELIIDEFEPHAGVPQPGLGGLRMPDMPTTMGQNLTMQTTTQKVDDNRTTEGAQPFTHIARRNMHETPIQYGNIVKRPIPVATFMWQVGDVVGTILYSARLPDDLLTNCQQIQPFNNMYLWRGNIKLRLHVNSTQFHQGLMWMGYVPGVCMTVANTMVFSRTNWSNLPGGYCNAFAPNDIELEVPFLNPRDFTFTKQLDNDTIEGSVGTLYIGVMSQLATTGTTTQRVDCTLFVEFPDSQFYLPKAVDDCVSLDMPRFYDAVRTPELDTTRHEPFETHGGSNSVHKSVEINYWGVNDSNIGTELEGDELDATSKLSGTVEGASMDKPFVGTNPAPTVRKAIGTFNNKANIEFIDKLTNEGKEQCPAKKAHYARHYDEMNISYILSISSFATELVWNTTDIAYTVIKSGLICPSPINVNDRVDPAGADAYGFAQTPLDYLTGQFLYWKGPINLHVKVLASCFQAGLIRVSAVYGDYSMASNAHENNCQWSAYINLKDSTRDYDFTFEFPCTVPYLRCTSQHYTDLTTFQRTQMCVGSYYFTVMNPLTVGTGATTNVKLQMYWSAPKLNYYFLKPPSVVPSDATVPPALLEPVPEAFEPQMLKVGHPLSTEPFVVKLEPVSPVFQARRLKVRYLVDEYFRKLTDPFEPHMQVEEPQATQAGAGIILGTKAYAPPLRYTNLLPTVSLRDLMRRYIPVVLGTGANTNFYVASLTSSHNTQPTSNMYWIFGCMYLGRRGGSRYKILRNITAGSSTPVSYTPQSITFVGRSTTQVYSQFSAVAQAVAPINEVETSFTSEYNYLMHLQYAGTGDQHFVNEGSLNVPASAQSDIYYAGADDFRLGVFLGPPMCVILYQDLV